MPRNPGNCRARVVTSGEGGIRRNRVSGGETALLESGDAESDAEATDFDLARLITAWSALPASVKATVMELVEREAHGAIA